MKRDVHFDEKAYPAKEKDYSLSVMYPTSHYIDPKKKTDLRKGRAILMKIKGADGYSTVYKQARTKDVHGQPFRKTLRGKPIQEKYLKKTKTRLNKWDMRKIIKK